MTLNLAAYKSKHRCDNNETFLLLFITSHPPPQWGVKYCDE